MFIYDDYKEVKSIDDLNVKDLLLFSIDKTKLPSTLTKRRLNSEWIVISKIDGKQIIIRNRYGKQIIKLSSLKIRDGFIKFQMNEQITLTFKIFYKKKYSVISYVKNKVTKFLKWVFLKS
jgi:uncharacterized protein (DUF952 family)